MLYIMMTLQIYPLFYDILQLVKHGCSKYAEDPWNFVDQGFIWIGFTNVALQRVIPDILNPVCKIFLIIQTLLLMNKTLFFFRISPALSTIVSMFKSVTQDLFPFMLTYLFLLLSFALTLAIIDIGNLEYSDNLDYREIQYTPDGPDREYLLMNKLFARMIAVMRISIGDF